MFVDNRDRVSKVPKQNRRTRLVLQRLQDDELERDGSSEILSVRLSETH